MQKFNILKQLIFLLTKSWEKEYFQNNKGHTISTGQPR